MAKTKLQKLGLKPLNIQPVKPKRLRPLANTESVTFIFSGFTELCSCGDSLCENNSNWRLNTRLKNHDYSSTEGAGIEFCADGLKKGLKALKLSQEFTDKSEATRKTKRKSFELAIPVESLKTFLRGKGRGEIGVVSELVTDKKACLFLLREARKLDCLWPLYYWQSGMTDEEIIESGSMFLRVDNLTPKKTRALVQALIEAMLIQQNKRAPRSRKPAASPPMSSRLSPAQKLQEFMSYA